MSGEWDGWKNERDEKGGKDVRRTKISWYKMNMHLENLSTRRVPPLPRKQMGTIFVFPWQKSMWHLLAIVFVTRGANQQMQEVKLVALLSASR